MSKPNILAEPILVGREKELEKLQSLLNSAIEGKGKTVFVSGEAGSGKTRLAREFLRKAAKQGVAVMAGWCLSDAQVPYFPFMEAFNSYYSTSNVEEPQSSFLQPQSVLGLGAAARVGMGGGGMEITSWLTGVKPEGKVGMLSPQVWKDQIFATVSETLHTIAAQAPVVLFIEDAHWADSASLALLHYIARAIHDEERVLVVATFRSEGLIADAEGHPHPLVETLRLMRREELFEEINLSSLDQANISKMAESMLGASLQPEFAGKLAIRSEGSPLFIVEAIRMFLERGNLIKEENCWRFDQAEVKIPSKIRDIILSRLGSLKREERRMLDAASVIGEKFNAELLAAVLSKESLLVLETLNGIAESTSLIACEADSFRFDHGKSREAIYEEIPLPLKKGYHARIAEKIESSSKGNFPPLSDLAYHYAQASNLAKAVSFALAAGKDELTKWSNEQAAAHFRYVLQNIKEENAEERRIALEGLGDAYFASSKYGEAIKAFDELAAVESGIVKLRAIRKASDVAYTKGDEPDLLLEYAKKAEALAFNDRLEMARIINNRGHAWWYAGRGDSNQDLADFDAALQVFEEENSLADIAEASHRSGVLSTTNEELRLKGLTKVYRSIIIFRELGDVRKEIKARVECAVALRESLLFPEAKRELYKVVGLSKELNSYHELSRAYWQLGLYDELDGNFSEAISKSLKSLEYSKKTDAAVLKYGIYCRLVSQFIKLLDLEHAEEYLEQLTDLTPEVRSQINVFSSWVCAMGVYFAYKGLWQESEAIFDQGFDRAAKSKSDWSRIPLRSSYAWALDRQGRFEEAKDVRDESLKVLKQAQVRFEHANLQASMITCSKVSVDEDFEIRLDLINVGRNPCMPVKVEGIILPELKFSSLPSFCKLQKNDVTFVDRSIGAFEAETIRLKLAPAKAGSYVLTPIVFYLDDLGNTKAFKVNPIVVTVKPAKPAFEVLPGRVTTGTNALDRLLYGGIPEGYAVALVSPSFEERQKIIENYVEVGSKSDQITFYITAEPGSAKALVEKYPSSMFLFVCNPRADLMVKDLPNVYRIKGLDNLTEIDIALTKASRQLNGSLSVPKRVCIEIVSDALLQHHAVTTRKWLTGLITTLKSKGFTTMAVIDPLICPEEVPAITSLFEGEIRIAEKETENGIIRTLRVLKLQGQVYLKDEVSLT